MKKPAIPQIDFAALVNDFRGLDPKEIGNWPVAPKIVVLVVTFVLLLAAGWYFDWNDQLADLDGRRVEEQKLKDEYVAKKSQAINLDEYRKQLADIDRAFGTLLKQLPNKAEMDALIVDVNQAGLGRGLQFELWKPGGESLKDFYAELPITIRVVGNYHDLGNFAGDVAKLARIVTLSDIAINMGADQQLSMDATAVTYRYLDDEEAAAMKQSAKGKK